MIVHHFQIIMVYFQELRYEGLYFNEKTQRNKLLMRSWNIQFTAANFLQVFDKTKFSERMTIHFDIGFFSISFSLNRPVVKLYL